MADMMPTARADRIGEVDIVRGVALFGVLWINLFQHEAAVVIIPASVLSALPTAPIDAVVAFIAQWVMEGKAQTLFSLLFGFSFALLMERSEARGARAGVLYFRRASILLALGFANVFLFWVGDILHAYATAGLLLLLLQVRRWPGWLLLAIGITFAVCGQAALGIWDAWVTPPGAQPEWIAVLVAGAVRRWTLFQGSDYSAYVVELVRAFWELYSYPIGAVYIGWIFGRFLIGSWIFRQGWLQNCAAYARGFRCWAMILIPAGLLLAGIGPALRLLGIHLPPAISPLLGLNARLAQLVLALGYGAGIVTLCQNDKWRRRLSGFGAAGQMALTNYFTQSFLFLFVLYGFGLGWLPYAGATFCLVLAVAVFAAQIWFSRWWLARYRFGPLEWLWRCGTYGRWQPMRLSPDTATAAPAAV